MDKRMQIRQSQSLDDLKRGMSRFADNGKQSVDRIDKILGGVSDQLRQRVNSEQSKKERPPIGRSPVSSPVPEPLSKAKKALLEVERQMNEYRGAAARMKSLLDNSAEKAKGMLQIKIMEIEKYLAIDLGMGNLGLKPPLSKEDNPLQAGPQGPVPNVQPGGFQMRYFEQTRILEVNVGATPDGIQLGKEPGAE